MQEKIETEETIGFSVTFLSLVAFQLGDEQVFCPPGYAYGTGYDSRILFTISLRYGTI